MCGRYSLCADNRQILTQFGMDPTTMSAGFVPRYNIAPGSSIPVILNKWPEQIPGGRRVLESYQWGFIPHWAKDPKAIPHPINARAETVATQPFFREAFHKRRCIIPANGFYEWQKTGKDRQPWYFTRTDDKLLSFAGLWDEWHDPAAPENAGLPTCTILVTQANAVLSPIHDRMPVVIGIRDYDRWLNPDFQDLDALQALLRPMPDRLLEGWPVSKAVNNPRKDGPELIARQVAG